MTDLFGSRGFALRRLPLCCYCRLRRRRSGAAAVQRRRRLSGSARTPRFQSREVVDELAVAQGTAQSSPQEAEVALPRLFRGKATTSSTSSTTKPVRSLGSYTGAFTARRTFAAIGTLPSTPGSWDSGGFEIQAGTTKVIKTFDMLGNPDGCAKSKSGDVAFSIEDNGHEGCQGSGVDTYPGGTLYGTFYPGPKNCNMPAAYDRGARLFYFR